MQAKAVRPLGSPRARLIAVLCLVAVFAGAARGAAAECLSGDRLPTLQPAAVRPAQAGQPNQPGDASGPTTQDVGHRMVAPVVVGGQGPFPFIVDTGANRTALSQTLALRLGLTPTGSGEVHSVYGVATAPIVPAQRLTYGPLTLTSLDMPLIDGVVLGGEAGLLGVDSMHDQRLRMDFEQRCIEISASSTPFQHGGWTVVRGQLRFGNLVMVRGAVHGRTVNILIDTGSDSTLANFAFRDRLANILHTDAEGAKAVRAYTMGEPVVLHDALLIPSMMIGGVEIDHVRAYMGDFHIFHVWGLTEEPTLLIGMDVLSQTRAIIIDFGHATVYFRLRQRLVTGSRIPGATGAMTITP